jgi:NitT/TauT family transport system permease protein
MASGDMKMDVAFAIIVMLAFLGLFLYYLVVFFEKILVPWHVSQRSSVSGLVTTE